MGVDEAFRRVVLTAAEVNDANPTHGLLWEGQHTCIRVRNIRRQRDEAERVRARYELIYLFEVVQQVYVDLLLKQGNDVIAS